MKELTVRVESIYDVALAKLLLDHADIKLVNPSESQQKLLGVDPLSIPHDVHIGDLEYRSGIQLKGEAKILEQLENILRENLPDAVVFKHPIQQDAIYYARVQKYIYRKRLAILDLGGGQKGIMFNTKTNEGDYHLVQVKELTTEEDKLPVCDTTITLSGDYVILEVDANFVRVSRKIKGKDRQKLHSLGKKILPPGFGIIIRTSANGVDETVIEEEIDQLSEMWAGIEREAENKYESGEVISGEKVSEILLGYSSKEYLDKILNQMTTLIPNYHYFRAYSMASGFTADFGQNFVDRVDPQTMSDKLKEMIINRDYAINNHIKAEFNFTDGTQQEKIIGNIISNDNDVIVTRTTLHSDHDEKSPIFDIHEDDRLEIHFAYGTWTLHYKYYSGLTGNLIGQKLRIITPLDFVYRGRIRAFDMGMTIYKNAEGEMTSQVDDSTSDMVEKGMISQSLDEKLGEVLRVAMSMLKETDDEILIHLSQ